MIILRSLVDWLILQHVPFRGTPKTTVQSFIFIF